MNRTKRKKLARIFKSEFKFTRIPNARESNIIKLSKELDYMYNYERYANW
jgi:hypothetical protein